MPRLRQISRDETTDELVVSMYDRLFGDRDPVAEPGTASGTPGDWWTVFALVPDVLKHSRPRVRVVRQPEAPVGTRDSASSVRHGRAGCAVASSCSRSTASRAAALGISEEKIAAIPAWQVADCFDATERALLAYTDALVSDGGRVADATFDAMRAELSDEQILEFTYITTHVRDARNDEPGTAARVRRS